MPFLLAARAFLGRIPREVWIALVAAGALLTLWAWHNGKVSAAYDRGVTTERAAWETEAARLRAVAAQEALQRLEAVNDANAAAISARVALDALALETRNAANAYYKANPTRNVPCLSDDRLRAIAAADAAASKAAAAPK
jgi:hypothetical protein